MKSKKMKIILPGLAVGAMLAGLVSCGGSSVQSDYTPFEGDPTKLTATVTFWDTMSTANEGDSFLTPLIKEFNSIYPNITVKQANKSDYDTIKENLVSAIPAGTTPTLAFCYPDHVAEYIKAGASLELTGFMNDPIIGFGHEDGNVTGNTTTLADIDEGYLKEGQEYSVEGTYSLPFAKSTEALFYNKTVFDEKNYKVPETLDDAIELARQMRKDFPEIFTKENIGSAAPLGWDSAENFFITYCYANDIPYTQNVSGSQVQFNNDKAKEFVNKVKDWYDEGLIVFKDTLANSSYTSTLFAEQKLFMTVGSTGGAKYNAAEAFTQEVTRIPKLGSKRYSISQGPSITFFKKSDNENYAGWLFYKFLTNTKWSAQYSANTGYSPIRTSSFDEESIKSAEAAKDTVPVVDTTSTLNGSSCKNGADKYLAAKMYGIYKDVFADKETFASPVFVGSATCRKQVGGIISAVCLGTKTVDDAFKDAVSACAFAIGE